MTDSPEDANLTREAATTPSAREESADRGSSASVSGIPTKQIGQYHIRRMIAVGGMGTVYEAVQEKPKRTVAVKVMSPGMSSRSAMRRFEYESQILARLRHPGIAQVFEAGTSEDQDGQGTVPYFVMEYIPNARSITAYAHDKQLSVTERLQLFQQVCDAVHHGHQKGIIHRDLKPPNILIDPQGRVKVIDFGVARATDSDMAVATLQTEVGQLVGTLQYMSPEQIDADPHDIDVRSDVYSLGVILYELLGESLPYDITNTPIYEAARVIREQPPIRLPLTKKSMRGELETITHKAIAKEREQRYQSAADLSQDIERYLNNEPIEARPPSLIYQVRVFARRNRLAFGATVAVFLALLLGVIGTTMGFVEADHRRADAEREAQRAMEINQFLKDMLTSVDPSVAQGEEVTVRDLLDDLVAGLDDAFQDSPEMEAEIRATIGQTYRNLGRYDEALPQLRRALELRTEQLGERHPDTLQSMTRMAEITFDLGDRVESERRFREALALQIDVLGEDDPLVLSTTNGLAWAVYTAGRAAEAEPLFRRALTLHRAINGDDAAPTTKTMTNLAVALIQQEKLEEAQPLIEDAVEASRRVLSDRHPDTIYAVSIHAWLLREQEKFAEADAIYADLINRSTTVLGPDHKHTLFFRHARAWTIYDSGDITRAEAMLRPVLSDRMRILGPEHPETMDSMLSLAEFLIELDRFEEAEQEFRRALTLRERAGTEMDPQLMVALSGVVRSLTFQQRFEDAELLARRYRSLAEQRQAAGNPSWIEPSRALMESLYDAWERPDEATRWRAESTSD